MACSLLLSGDRKEDHRSAVHRQTVYRLVRRVYRERIFETHHAGGAGLMGKKHTQRPTLRGKIRRAPHCTEWSQCVISTRMKQESAALYPRQEYHHAATVADTAARAGDGPQPWLVGGESFASNGTYRGLNHLGCEGQPNGWSECVS